VKASFIGLTSLRLANRAPSLPPMKHRRSRPQRSPFVLLTLLAVLSITCNFGGLLPGTSGSGELNASIFSIEPGVSVDDNGQVVDARYVFAPTDAQMEVVVQVGVLSAPAAMSVTWYEMTDAGDQKLFTHTVQVSEYDRAYSIGKNPGTLAEGDYKIIAAVNGQTQQIEVTVAQPTLAQIQAQIQAGKAVAAPGGQSGPPVDGGSGKTASAASSNPTPSSGNAPSSAGCTITVDTDDGNSQDATGSRVDLVVINGCAQPADLLATMDGGAPITVGVVPANGLGFFSVNPCTLSGGTDLPGKQLQLYTIPHTSGTPSGTGAQVKAGPIAVTLGPDISPPHLNFNPNPKPGKLPKGTKQITLDITAEEVRAGESWQEGVKDIQVFANGTLIDHKDFLNLRGISCDPKSWKQTLQTIYKVPPNTPLITLCVLAEDFAEKSRRTCRDFINGDHWTGTIRSTSNAIYARGAGTCVNEKWLFNLDIYVAADGTVAGKGTGQLTSLPQCRLNGNNKLADDAHKVAFTVSGKLNGQNFQLFFANTYQDGKTYGMMDWALLYSGTSLAADMPPFIFSIQGQGSASGDVTIAYTPANADGDKVSAEHLINMTCRDCSK
jgi:hypothetical protein